MGGHMMLYRGSLKSCNYRCSYCPFSKHPMSERELERDKKQWLSFQADFEKCAAALSLRALMVVPYGEALIHSWYLEGLAHISSLSGIDAVGAQTNLSFHVQEFLTCFEKAGGRIDKLRLWATFHPEMTTVLEFAKKCRELKQAGVVFCAGAVGAPENAPLLRELRDKLPRETYLWVNKMDGLKRRYTAEEERVFTEIDPYFFRELIPTPADFTKCEGRLFVEGNGAVHTCNISRKMETSWKEWGKTSFPAPSCGRKQCSCFLAYGGREDFINKMLFGDYPLFRIPRHPRAVFLDIEGTLFPANTAPKPVWPGKRGAQAAQAQVATGRGQKFEASSQRADWCGAADKTCGIRGHNDECPADILAGLEALYREKTRLFFATTLPYKEAMKRCRKIRCLFQGGIFAGGAHIVLEDVSEESPGENFGKNSGENFAANFTENSINNSTENSTESSTGEGKKRESFSFLDRRWPEWLGSFKQKYSFRILTCREKERLYKITLFRSSHRPWEGREAGELFAALPEEGREEARYFIEGNCLEIVSAKADKAQGVKTLCNWIGVSPRDAFAAGDSKEDEEMVRLCGQGEL